MVSRVFVKNVEGACDEALCALSAKRPHRGTRYFEVNDDVFCWVGLNQGRHSDFLRINPFVGIHFVSMMKLCALADGDKYKKGAPATYAVHLGELCPDVEQFIFTEKSDIHSEAERLAQTIVEFGLPYVQSHSLIESIMPMLKERIPTLGGYPELYLVGLYLLGRMDEAKKFISDQSLVLQSKYDQSIQDNFENFSGYIVEKIQSENTLKQPAINTK